MNLRLRSYSARYPVLAVRLFERLARGEPNRIYRYDELAKACLIDIRGMGSALNYVGCWCLANELPVLTALVRDEFGYVGEHYPIEKFGDPNEQTRLVWNYKFNTIDTPTARELWEATRKVDPTFHPHVNPSHWEVEEPAA